MRSFYGVSSTDPQCVVSLTANLQKPVVSHAQHLCDDLGRDAVFGRVRGESGQRTVCDGHQLPPSRLPLPHAHSPHEPHGRSTQGSTGVKLGSSEVMLAQHLNEMSEVTCRKYTILLV